MSKTTRYWLCPKCRKDCFAYNNDGTCNCLRGPYNRNSVEFNGKDCGFYKTKEQYADENIKYPIVSKYEQVGVSVDKIKKNFKKEIRRIAKKMRGEMIAVVLKRAGEKDDSVIIEASREAICDLIGAKPNNLNSQRFVHDTLIFYGDKGGPFNCYVGSTPFYGDIVFVGLTRKYGDCEIPRREIRKMISTDAELDEKTLHNKQKDGRS